MKAEIKSGTVTLQMLYGHCTTKNKQPC